MIPIIFGQKYASIYRLNTKIRLTMLCLSVFELCSRWVSLILAPIFPTVRGEKRTPLKTPAGETYNFEEDMKNSATFFEYIYIRHF